MKHSISRLVPVSFAATMVVVASGTSGCGTSESAEAAQDSTVAATSSVVEPIGGEEIQPLPPENSYLSPSFEHTAARDGLIVVEVDELDVATYDNGDKVRLHLCDGRITRVVVGDFQVGDPIRVSCYASLTPESLVPAGELAMAVYEATVAPEEGDEILVAPQRDEEDGSRFFAERLYFTADGQIALRPGWFGAPAADVADGSVDKSWAAQYGPTDVESFVALWQAAHPEA